MPLASALAYVQGLLNQLPMPAGLDNMDSYVIPPDPNVQTTIPTAYVWPTKFGEKRDPKNGGSMPRNTGPGTGSGIKTITHNLDIFIVWMAAGDDSSFPGIVDAVMKALRTATPMPVEVTDPNDGTVSQLDDIGEVMDGDIYFRSLEDEAFSRYDCPLRVPVTEEISA